MSCRLMCPACAPDNMKNASLAIRIAIAGAVALNRSLRGDRFAFVDQNNMTTASRTTVMVPADGPNSSTDVKTNVSETESLAEIAGTFTVKDPVSSVRAASMNHSAPGGFADNRQSESQTTRKPA